MHKVWRSLGEFARPIPDNVASSFKKRTTLLEGEIARRTVIRRRLVAAAIVAIVCVTGFVAWLVLGHARAAEFLRALDTALEQQQAHPVEKLLEQARTKDRRLLDSADVNAAFAKADELLNREKTLLDNFDASLGKMPDKLDGPPNAARFAAIADQLTLTRAALNALAPDLKTENEPRLQSYENQWHKVLLESGSQISGTLDKLVTDGEAQCNNLDYGMPLDKAGVQLSAVSNLLQSINNCELGFTNLVDLRSDLLQRSATLQSRYAAFAHEFNKITDGLTQLRATRTMDQFSAAVKLVASSEFSGTPPVRFAVAIQGMDVSPETTLRRLLGMTNESTWTYLQKKASPQFLPEIMMPAERTIFDDLNTDPAISGIHEHCRLWLDAQGSQVVEWITSGVLQKTEGWTKISAWSPSPGATSAIFTDQTYGFFNQQYKLTPTQPIYRVEESDPLDETAAFGKIGLEAVRIGGNYQQPLLEILDALKHSTDGSPLFRAYLFLRLIDVMNLQPDAWGISFCPVARSDAAQLRAMAGNNLQSGDWFIPEKVNQYSTVLNQVLGHFPGANYMKQAGGLFALSKAAAAAGLAYAGYVGMDGSPNLIDGQSTNELWTLAGKDGAPALLSTSNQSLPLAPIFSLGESRSDLLTNASISVADPVFAGVLPPLFKE
jgi:hypothetical protein